MKQLESLTRDNLHHAHLLIRNTEGVYEELCLFFEERLSIKTKGNPDFVFEEFDKFLIDDARRIFDLHIGKTSKDSIQVIVISFNFITSQAQNALLKMLEEPKPRTHFFIISPNKNMFLDTIISRVSVFDIDGEKGQRGIREKGEEFIKMSLKQRLAYVATFVKDIKEEKKSKQDVTNLLSGLELAMRETIGNPEEYKRNAFALKQIIKSREFINLNGASMKNLLENIALSV